MNQRYLLGLRPPRRLAAVLGVAWILIASAGGCGPSGPTRIPVHGRVTFNGNSPPGDGTVYFNPIEAAGGLPRRPASGNFQEGKGEFVVTSIRPKDGLLPGTYRVMVRWWEPGPNGGSSRDDTAVRQQHSLSDLEVKEDQSGPMEVNYDVPRAAARR